ncbi:hypothetical protein [Streptomyces sp. DSM 41636]|uniref:Uncharacterized protein n=1 Tax=Streptomyces edwardsiae TaxID=3075527 RepID=A0ABU2PP72_9ACTN|nr:hypothetical protein [Streptomyces sp. DSM 41636]MDT0393637.1 hypothetical protein [Streptomyces sp. DSM 41636]
MNVQDGSRTVPGGQCFRDTAPVRLLAKGTPWSAAAVCERRDDGTERSGRLRVVRLIAADSRSPSAEHAGGIPTAAPMTDSASRTEETACFEAVYSLESGMAITPFIGEVLTIAPPPVLSIARIAVPRVGLVVGRRPARSGCLVIHHGRLSLQQVIVRLCDRAVLGGGTAGRGRHAVPPCR